MRALQLNEERELEFVDSEAPVPGPGEVLVSIQGASLNHRDIWITKGLYPGMKLPSILGGDGSGVVSAVGEDVEADLVGNEVVCYPGLEWGEDSRVPNASFRLLGMPDAGFFAESIALPAENLVPKPQHLDFHQAAAFPVAGLTAWRGLTRHGEVGPGSRVLVTGIGGGVAQFGLLFAKALGAEVFVTSSRQDKIDRSIELGAQNGVNYRSEGWNRELAAMSGGIDVVLDGAPPEDLDSYGRFLRPGARIVVYGATGGFQSTVHLPRFFLQYRELLGTSVGSSEEFSAMMEFVEQRGLEPEVSRTFAFEDLPGAFEYLASGLQTGKVTIDSFPQPD